MLIDTHAHLNFPKFQDDLPSVIQNAKNAGVGIIINIGTDIETSRQVVSLQSDQIRMFSTIGIHPHEAIKLCSPVSIHESTGELEKIHQSNTSKIVAVDPDIIGIGECGLDYYFGKDDEFLPPTLSETEVIALQKQLFQAQIDLAKKIKLPLIIHCREAWQDIFDFDYSDLKVIFHSFSSNMENAQKALDRGFYLGINCTITYPKNEYLREVVKTAPMDKLLTETDCPFLPPQSHRGQRNESANVAEVAKAIAKIKGIPFENVADYTYKNACDVFGIDR